MILSKAGSSVGVIVLVLWRIVLVLFSVLHNVASLVLVTQVNYHISLSAANKVARPLFH